jgi:hypothetical protein
MISITFIDAIRMYEIADKLFENKIALNDGQMIALRNIYKQLSESEKEFILDKFGESMDFLENYEGVRKRTKQG